MPLARPGFEKALPILVFFSGGSALIYESLWMRSFGLIFGNTTRAVTIVLATFMGGLALGSLAISRLSFRRAIRAYAAVEAGIGLSALLTLPLLHTLPAWYGSYVQENAPAAPLDVLLRVVLVSLILLVPMALIGATFPLAVESLTRTRDTLRSNLGSLYLTNTLGGATGVLLGPFALLPFLGVSNTLRLAATVNIAIGLAALWLARDTVPSAGSDAGAKPRSPGAAGRRPLPSLFILVTLATGASALGLEILWTRAFSLVINSSIYSFNLMLLAFLLGIVLGTAGYQSLRTRRPDTRAWLAILLIALGALILLDVAVVGWLPLTYFNLMKVIPATFAAHQMAGFLICGLTMLPITTLYGFLFPFVTHLVEGEHYGAQEISGRLYAWNTFGAISGALVCGFVLIPRLGIQTSFVVISDLPILAGLEALGLDRSWGRLLRAGTALAAVLVIAAAGRLYRPWDPHLMTAGIYKNGLQWSRDAPAGFFWLRDQLHREQTILFYKEGQEGVVSVTGGGGDRWIAINGKTEGGTLRDDMVTQRLLAHLPLMLHPQPISVLSIGWGSGCTAGVSGLYPLAEVRVDEIEPAMFEPASLFSGINFDIQRDPRFRILFKDARNDLFTSSRSYDVIISEPSNPWISGVSNLFTMDFYRIVRARLRPGGIFSQWFHYSNMRLEDVLSQLKSFCGVFPHASLWLIPPSSPEQGPPKLNGDMLLIGSEQTHALDHRRVQDLLKVPAIAGDLKQAGVTDDLSLALDYTLDQDDMRRLAGGAPYNTDDRPRIELEAPKGLYVGTDVNERTYAALEKAAGEIVPPLVNAPLPDPQDAKALAGFYVDLASRFLGKMKVEQATRAYQAALKLEGDSAEAYAGLGQIRYFRGDLEQAESLLLRALAKNPSLKLPYDMLGLMYLRRGDLQRSRQMYAALGDLFPAHATG